MILTVYPSSYDSTNSSYRSFGSGHEADQGYNDKDGASYCQINANNGSNAETKFYFKFNLSLLPSNATINSVSCVVKTYASSLTNISTATVQMSKGTTTKGSATNLTTSSTQHTLSVGTWTASELAEACIYIHYVRTNQNTTTSRSVRFYGATLTVDYTVENPIPNLITDRTQADVDYVRSLCAKGIPNMSNDELTEFLTTLKGAYNYTDLNRVETAVAYVVTELIQAPTDIRQYASDRNVAWDDMYDVPYDPDDYSGITIKTNWSVSDIPTNAQMIRYIGNIKLIQEAIPDASIAWIPDTMDNLDYSLANNIEKLLKDVHEALIALVAFKEGLIRSAMEMSYSGDIYSGEEEA